MSLLQHLTAMLRFASLLLLIISGTSAVHAAQVALIIDDIGYKPSDAKAFQLPTEVTFAILPHTPFSKRFAALAEQQQREVMLHMPMESLSGKKLGPGGITSVMYPQDIQQQLAQALLTVPNAVGVNNHMGSKLTQLTLPMTATMQYLRSQGMYFIDSRTTRYSKAERIAREVGIATRHRHVFLDHVVKPEHIAFQFGRLLSIVQKQGQAIAIAHPYPETLKYLQRHLPELEQDGIRLVPVSDLIQPESTRFAANQLP